jgi:hypothetical protein
MKISEIKRGLPHLIAAKVPALLIGHHGLGKSSVMRQIADESGMTFFDVRLGTMCDPGDLLGLMIERQDAEGNKSFEHVLPAWWPKAGERKMIFIDEINRARPDMLQMVFQLILDRRIHTHVLPEGCTVHAAMNPDSNDYKTTNIDDAALLSRFCQIKFTPSQEEFLEYARSKPKFDSTFLGFVAENMQMVDCTGLESFEVKAKPDRRAIVRAEEVLSSGLPEDLWIEMLGGMLGYEMAVKYVEYVKSNEIKPLTFEQVVGAYNKHSHVVAAMMKKERHDVVTVTVDNVLSELFKRKDLTKKESLNIRSFLLDIPKDITQGFINRFLSDSPSHANNPVSININKYVLDDAFVETFSAKVK